MNIILDKYTRIEDSDGWVRHEFIYRLEGTNITSYHISHNCRLAYDASLGGARWFRWRIATGQWKPSPEHLNVA